MSNRLEGLFDAPTERPVNRFEGLFDASPESAVAVAEPPRRQRRDYEELKAATDAGLIHPSVLEAPPSGQPEGTISALEPKKYTGFMGELWSSMKQGTAGVAQPFLETMEHPRIQEYAQSLGKYRYDPRFRPSGGGGAAGFTARAIGGTVPFMAATTTAGAVGGLGFAVVVAYKVEGDNQYKDAKDRGATEERAEAERHIVGLLNAGIEYLQVGRLLKFARGGGKTLTKQIVDAAKKKAFTKAFSVGKKLSVEMLKVSAEEGLEEALQETTGIIVPDILDKKIPSLSPEEVERIGMAGLGGAIGGGLIGGGGAITQSLIGTKQQAQGKEIITSKVPPKITSIKGKKITGPITSEGQIVKPTIKISDVQPESGAVIIPAPVEISSPSSEAGLAKAGPALPQAAVQPTAAKQPWEMTKLEIGTQSVTSWKPTYPFKWTNLEGKTEFAKTETQLQQLRNRDFARHKELVQQAITEGKPVPAAVLAEYPGVKFARRPDGTLKTKAEYSSEEWKDYTGSVIESKQAQAPVPQAEAAPKAQVTEGKVKVIDEESYLAQHGASRQGFGDAALHKNIKPGRAKQQALKRMSERNKLLFEKRERLRKEYKDKIDSGEIRPPSRTERLIGTAKGHPDLEATKAAQRLLKKQGIDWQAPAQPVTEGKAARTKKTIKKGGFIDFEGPAKTAQEVIEINRKLARRLGLTGKIKDIPRTSLKTAEAVSAGVSYCTAPIDYKLEKISPRLSQGVRRHAFDVIMNTHRTMEKLAGLFRSQKAWGGMSTKDENAFNDALFKRDFATAGQIAKRSGFGDALKDARAYLEEAYQRGLDNGLSTKYREDYWPQRVKDMEGLLKYLYRDQTNRSIIEDARRSFTEKRGRVPTDREMEDIVNVLIRGYKTSGVVLNKPGFSKTRRIEYVDKDLRKFYYDPIKALKYYIHDLETTVATNQFFGKVNKEFQKLKRQESLYRNRVAKAQATAEKRRLTPKEAELADNAAAALELVKAEIKNKGFDNPAENAGRILNELLKSGEIKPGQDTEAQKLLKLYFNPNRMNAAVRAVVSLNYFGKLGNSLILHNLTQLPESGLSVLESPMIAVGEIYRAFTGKSEVKTKDMPFVQHIGVEFQELSLDELVTKVLGVTMYTDKPGKVALVNTVIKQGRKLAKMKKPPVWFIDRLKLYHGDDWKGVLNNLRSGELTDDVLFYGFSRLSDRQPITKAQQSLLSLEHPNIGRPAMMFKTFTLRRIYSVINDVRRDFKAGRYRQGITMLFATVSLLFALDLSANIIKGFYRSWFSGKKPKPATEQAVDTALKNLFLSRYQIGQLKYRTPEEVFGQIFIPQTFVTDLWQAGTKARYDPLIRNIPAIGQETVLLDKRPSGTQGVPRTTIPRKSIKRIGVPRKTIKR